MAASATASSFLALPAISAKTQFLCNPKLASAPLFSAKFGAKPLRASSDKLSRRFVRHVAVSDEVDSDDLFGDREERSLSADLKIFVGNLAFTVDSAQLADLFGEAGTVEMVEVIYDKETGRSRGFGFVTMSSAKEVEAAVQQFDGFEFEGRALRVNSGPPPPKREGSFNREPRGAGGYDSFNREPRGAGGYDSFNRGPPRGGGGGGGRSENKVHVSNLSWGVDDSALESLFSEQGNVLEAKVIYDRDTGRSRGFGFVTYGSADEVNSAIESLDGADMDGRQIRVAPAENRPRRF